MISTPRLVVSGLVREERERLPNFFGIKASRQLSACRTGLFSPCLYLRMTVSLSFLAGRKGCGAEFDAKWWHVFVSGRLPGVLDLPRGLSWHTQRALLGCSGLVVPFLLFGRFDGPFAPDFAKLIEDIRKRSGLLSFEVVALRQSSWHGRRRIGFPIAYVSLVVVWRAEAGVEFWVRFWLQLPKPSWTCLRKEGEREWRPSVRSSEEATKSSRTGNCSSRRQQRKAQEFVCP